MKSIGIKLADGSFYPIMEDGKPCNKTLSLTTVKDNQTTVKVDLYQSETGTMEGAKYLDTLEIENLNPHPNGEPDFNLTVELDENNNLSAKVNDPETNKESSKAVNLIKRATEELSDSAIAAAKQLAESFRSFDNPKSEGAEATIDKDIDIPEESLEETPVEEYSEATTLNTDDIENAADDIPESISDEITADNNTTEAPDTFDTSELDTLTDENFNIDDALNDDTLANDAIIENPEVLDDNDNTTNNITDNIAADDGNTFTDEIPVDNNEFDLPDLDNLDIASSSTDNTNEATSNNSEDFSTDSILDNSNDILDNTNTDSLSLSDLDIDNLDANGNSPAENTASQSMFSEDEFSVPDFDDPQVQAQSLDLKDGTFDDPIFNLPDEQNNSLDLSDFDDGDFSTSKTADSKDNNTSNNYNNYNNSYTEKKSSNAPVIVCVICAIICLLATAFVFFVIPHLDLSKVLKITDNANEKVEEKDQFSDDIFDNINTNKEDNNPIEITIEEPKAPPAEENKIVVSPIPEVIPEKPVKAENATTEDVIDEKETTEEKVEGIRYRIKWGDTLWDLSDTYYRNPWLYPRIAKYNNIKDPDYIISGTFITIPK
ncbi:MAG: Hsp70 family protein [Treponema sp.]|nr:Hsp70 family protein [Treponema sp.]